MIDSLLNTVFFCSHKRTTFPLTPKRGDRVPEAAKRTGTYVVCLDCGKEFPYNWRELRIEPVEAVTHPAQPKKTGKAAAWLLQPLLRFLG
jgi:hypothetical protein